MKLLHIDSSPLAEVSVSRQLTSLIVEEWRRLDPAVEIIRRDLGAEPPAHLSNELLKLVRLGEDVPVSAELRAEIELSDRLIDEFLAADVVVIGAPMYNFTVSTQLKAWIDRIARAGRTFRYTANGPEGLAGGRKAIIVSSRGGIYSGDRSALDFQEPYLRAILNFMGVTDVTVIRAEGVNISPELRRQALDAARRQIGSLLPKAV
jgi:FMN-dependent NADH-azoreductase